MKRLLSDTPKQMFLNEGLLTPLKRAHTPSTCLTQLNVGLIPPGQIPSCYQQIYQIAASSELSIGQQNPF